MSRAALALALAALTLSGCETTAEESARLERQAKAHTVRVHHTSLVARVERESTKVRVISTTLLRSSEATAAVVGVQNTSSTPLRDIPIELTVHGASGASVYSNATDEEAASLVTIPLLAAHGALDWVDDQVRASATPVSVSARIGEGSAVDTATPAITVSGELTEEAGSQAVSGEVSNHSAVEQHELVVYCVALRGARIVAAGRAVIAQAPANASTHYELFLEGDASGAQLQLSAPASTLG
jgi:hypothetical protein